MKKTIHSSAYKTLREWLVQKRHARQLTQRQLGLLLGVPHSWVGKVEQGERRLDLLEYVEVCKALEVDPIEGLQVLSTFESSS